MKSTRSWISLAIPDGWAQVVIRTVEVALVAFVVLQLKEWLDAGSFDTAGTAADAVLIAAGILVVEAILIWTRPKAAS